MNERIDKIRISLDSDIGSELQQVMRVAAMNNCLLIYI